MNAKLCVILLVLAFGLGSALLGSAAIAQQAKVRADAMRSEYKVVQFGPWGGNAADAYTRSLNELAGQGWEYVGPMEFASYHENGNLMSRSYIAFKRAR